MCHFFWFMTACPDIQIINKSGHSFIRLSLSDGVACFIKLHRLHRWVARKMLGHMHKSRHSCPEFWVCLGLFGVHRLYHLRLQWHMPTKGPWAHHDSTCCAWCGKRASWKLQGWSAIGLEPNRLLVIPDRFTKPASSSHWMRKTEYIYVPWYAGDFQTVGGFQGSLISTKQPNANKWTTRKSLVGLVVATHLKDINQI